MPLQTRDWCTANRDCAVVGDRTLFRRTSAWDCCTRARQLRPRTAHLPCQPPARASDAVRSVYYMQSQHRLHNLSPKPLLHRTAGLIKPTLEASHNSATRRGSGELAVTDNLLKRPAPAATAARKTGLVEGPPGAGAAV